MRQIFKRMDQVKFVEDSLLKGCLPQTFLGPFLNTLFHINFSMMIITFITSLSPKK